MAQTAKEQYRVLCREREDIPVFFRDWWLDRVCGSWDVAVARKGTQITGIWPYQQERKIGMRLIRTPLLTPYLGPYIFFPEDLAPGNRDAFEYDTIAALLQELPAAEVWDVNLLPGCRQAGLLHAGGWTVQVQQTFLIDLSAGEDVLFARLRDSVKRNIRAGMKEFELIEAPGSLDLLRSYQETMLREKGRRLHADMEMLSALFRAASERNSTTLWAAVCNGETEALLWEVRDGKRAYYLMGGKKPGKGSYRAVTALIWNAVLTAKRRGLEYFDLEGSMDPGVERFFRGFGGQRELYIRMQRSSRLWKFLSRIRG